MDFTQQQFVAFTKKTGEIQPLVNQHSRSHGSCIVDFPIEMVIFHSFFVCLPESVYPLGSWPMGHFQLGSLTKHDEERGWLPRILGCDELDLHHENWFPGSSTCLYWCCSDVDKIHLLKFGYQLMVQSSSIMWNPSFLWFKSPIFCGSKRQNHHVCCSESPAGHPWRLDDCGGYPHDLGNHDMYRYVILFNDFLLQENIEGN